ncbi:MAG: type II toxin-antitoxin system VapC family toxin [Bacteroidaceae bacterium]|nr:type II toxin-antitoxin system VapC family toxin [Bacteroidaceae bacterium]
MRYLIDTHIYIWYAKDRDRLSRDVLAILDDYENQIYLSAESLREFVILWNNKPHIRRWWKSPLAMIQSVEKGYRFEILYLHKEHYERYARLEINEAQKHYDPSDHMIISHALCNNMPLISDDDKFPFYRGQGLELIEN